MSTQPTADRWMVGGRWGNVGVEIVEEGSGRQVAVVNRLQEQRRAQLAERPASQSEQQNALDLLERATLTASGDQALRRARILAASPDLLAALQALVAEDYFENDQGKFVECKRCGADDTTPCEADCLVSRARAAIAQAVPA